MYVSKDMGFGLKSYLFISNLIELWLKIMSCMTSILWNSYQKRCVKISQRYGEFGSFSCKAVNFCFMYIWGSVISYIQI